MPLVRRWYKSKVYWIPLVLLCGLISLSRADEKGVWVGTIFRPEQCLKIKAGRYAVKRKLCTIAYDIKPKNGRFDVDALMTFDNTFIPDKVSHVELEVLLMDNEWVCTRQLNLKSDVKENKARFSFTAEDTPGQRYVRTYYIIYYRQQ